MIIITPKIIYQYLFQKKHKGSLFSRLGFNLPKFEKKGSQEVRVWIHAVSLGETKAVEPLIKKIKSDWPDCKIIFSTATKTGYGQAIKNHRLIDSCFLLPLDFSFIMKKLVKSISPDLFVLVETDFWFNLLKELKTNGTKIALINGKISKTSFRNFSIVPQFAKKIFGFIDLYCLQGKEFRTRFLELGVQEGKIAVTGNVKYDISYEKKNHQNLQFPKGKRVVTVASTHKGEEEIILSYLEGLDEDICLFLAPRHPERFETVAKLLKAKNITYRRIDEQSTGREKVVLVNQMGILDQCYEASKATIMGGSFVQHVGGHNIYEPIHCNVPVIYGPYMEQQQELVANFKKHQVGEQVNLKSLKATLLEVLKRPKNTQKYKELKSEMEGATKRSWKLIKKL